MASEDGKELSSLEEGMREELLTSSDDEGGNSLDRSLERDSLTDVSSDEVEDNNEEAIREELPEGN